MKKFKSVVVFVLNIVRGRGGGAVAEFISYQNTMCIIYVPNIKVSDLV